MSKGTTFTRREFLYGVTVFTAGTWLLGKGALANPLQASGSPVSFSDRSVVGIAPAPVDAQIESAVREAIALAGGLPPNIGPGKVIVIHPNLVQAGHSSGGGVVTHARVVREIIRMCLEKGANIQTIFVVEGAASFYGSQGGYDNRSMTRKAFRDCGLDLDGNMYDDETGARLVDANNVGQLYPDFPGYSGPYNSQYVTHMVKPFHLNRVYVLPNVVANCDVLIRVPLIKNHNLAGATGALKLACGLAPTDIYHYPGLPYYKWALLHQPVHPHNELTTNAMTQSDMTLCRPPDLVVTDGLVGITNGPCGGDGGGGQVSLPMGGPMRTILASTDPVAIDAIQSVAIGYRADISSVPALYYAAQAGLGTDDLAKIEVRGDRVTDIRRWFPTWGSGKPGDRIAPTMTNLNVQLSSSQMLTVQPLGTYDASPGLCKGELYVDNVLVDSVKAPNLTASCSLAGASSGVHSVKYTIYDGMLNETSISRTVELDGGPIIPSALAVEDGERVFLGPVVYTGKSVALSNSTFFVANPEGTSGMCVRFWGEFPEMSDGQRLSIQGTLGSESGMRVMGCWSYSLQGDVAPVKSKFMNNRSIGGSQLNSNTPGVSGSVGPYNLGCLIRTSGRVTSQGPGHIIIEDGSLPGGVKVLCGPVPLPSVGSHVVVTGFSYCEKTGGVSTPAVALRSPADLSTV